MHIERDEMGLWFADAQVKIRVAQADNADGLSVMEHVMAKDFSPPWHVHHEEAESFYVLEGRIFFKAGDEGRTLGAGETLHIPANVPHGFKVLSETARMLTMTNGGFERAVRQVARPATVDAPPASWTPEAEELAAFGSAFAAQGIDLLGPPM